MAKYEKALVKYNSGAGALLCNGCKVILATGTKHVDAMHYCLDCKEVGVEDEDPNQPAYCDWCGGEKKWCDSCQMYTRTCCEAYGTCMCS